MANSEKSMIRRVVTASLIGATIEWYDFFLYGVIAGLVFNKQYFPNSDPMISTMLAYATFAVGFITRPLGGIIFGHFGDKLGRKNMLIMTLMIMGCSTVLIGLVPTYVQIGIWAPMSLLLLRIFQGIGLGGEWGGAVLMTYEYSPAHLRGLYGSLPQIGLAIGLCLASGVVALLSNFLTDAQFMAWGWRIAFLLSIVLVAVGLWIRLNVMETPEFQKVKNENAEVKIPIKEVCNNYMGNVVAGMGARYIDGVAFNIFGVWIISYLTQHINMTRTDALMGVLLSSLVMCFFIPLFCYLSDRVGRSKVYLWGSLITGFSAFPAFWMINTSNGSSTTIWLALVIPFGIFYASVYGPEAALFCELFPARIRYTGISFVYQFSGIFASGLTPIIATAIYKLSGGSSDMIAGYVAFAGVVSAASAYWIRTRLSKQGHVQEMQASKKTSVVPKPSVVLQK